MTKKERADTLVASRGLAESRQKAQALIMSGLVFSGEARVEKPGQLLRQDAALSVRGGLPFVSRGGLKLDQALTAFGIDVRGAVAADLGASTGGFTDCLLQRGARLVYAVDVSVDQLDWRLRNDPRVRTVEKNARYLRRGDFGQAPEFVAMDLSFISVLKVLPAVKGFLGTGRLVCLLKPQFEAGRGEVGKRGIIRDPARHEAVLLRLLDEARRLGFAGRGLIASSTRGQKGNREFLVWWELGRDAAPPPHDAARVREVVYEEEG
jgi:23S rRNA (cytidine1920-2'-O)/16S rRNA (cytidine1409-2'-O)-methyltransferase